MKFTRRQFVKGGVSAFTVGFAAPQFLTDLAFAQAAPGRNLVVLYLGGGNDALSTVVPYRDAAYYSRRPTLAVPAGSVLQIGTDSPAIELGLHPRLTGLQSDLRSGAAGDRPAHRLPELEPLALPGFRHLGHGQSHQLAGHRMAGALSRYAADAGRSAGRLEHDARDAAAADGAHASACPPSPTRRPTAFRARTAATKRCSSGRRPTKISSHLPVDRPHLAFVNSTAQSGARHARSGGQGRDATRRRSTYPNNGLAQALRAVAGAMNKQIGTKVFWVQTGGFDTHSGQGANAGRLRQPDGDGQRQPRRVLQDLSNQGLLSSTLVIVFSEFGRRISENGSAGTDHGAAGIMMALGGTVRGGIYGTAADLRQDPANPTLENNAGDVQVRNRLPLGLREGASTNGSAPIRFSILGADFKAGAPNIL